jgi:predicted nucleic acid-binding protein
MDEKFSLILDANVVIDYCHADENILALSARHLGNVFIPRPILNDEVKELDQKDCERIRLIISDPELDEIIAAGSKRGRLSFYDRLLLIMAKNRNWIAVTNEKLSSVGLDQRRGSSLMGVGAYAVVSGKESAVFEGSRKGCDRHKPRE